MTDTAQNPKLANPGPLGLVGFAMTTWLLSLINAGFADHAGLGLVIAMAFAMGGTAQLVAGLMEYRRGSTFGFTAFISYGGFWWSWALFVVFFKGQTPASFVGWYLLLWGIFTGIMFVGTLVSTRATQAVFLCLTVTFLLLSAGDFTQISIITNIGGVCGLITAIAALYDAAGQILNEAHRKVILPLGAK